MRVFSALGLFVASLILPDLSRAEMHAWRNLSGQTLQAEMVGMDIAARAVKVRRADGQEFVIPVASLSAEDVAYAAAQWRQMQAAGTAPATAPQTQSTPLKLPPRYAARRTEKDRLERILSHGGRPECETAVAKSLNWLKGRQNPDGGWGSWGADGRSNCGYSGFVLQCFTGHGEGPGSPTFGDTVTKIAEYFIRIGKSNAHGVLANNLAFASGAYEHAIATTGMGECYILAKAEGSMISDLEQTFEKAVLLILASQGKAGGWDYFTLRLAQGQPPTARGDLSVTHWVHQALLVARESGLKFPGLDTAIGKVVAYLESMQSRDGGFGGINKDAHYNQWQLSGGAILGLQTLSKRSSKTSKGIVFLKTFLQAEPMDWEKNCNLYSWAGYTPAFFLAGGEDWKFYVSQWLPQMLSAQQQDGSFKAGRASWSASHAPDPSYRQALCTLQLEVFYRYADAP